MSVKRSASVLALVAMTVLCLAGSDAKQYKLTQAWELSGLSRPESALYDAARDVVYISNVNGKPLEKNGNGFISKASLDGTMVTLEWIKGLNAPKGMVIVGDKLYVTDIDRLVEIDIAAGTVSRELPAKDAKFLNDVTADAAGNLYVSDMDKNDIWTLPAGGEALELWLHSGSMRNPNGLIVEGDNLIAAGFGIQGGSANLEGHLKKISLKTKKVGKVGSGKPLGHLDGIQGDGSGNYFVTDWKTGSILLVNAKGEATILEKTGVGAADLNYIPDKAMLLVPMMNEDKLVAYKVE